MKLKLFGVEIFVSKILLAVIIPVLGLSLIAAGFLIKRSGSGIIVENAYDNSGSTAQIESTAAEETMVKVAEDKIKVYVVGCVRKPGVVELEKGRIIDDAVKACGGATPEADIENVNLVYVLNENVMIRIKSKSEAQRDNGNKTTSAAPSAVKQTKTKSEAGTGARIVKNSGGAIEGEANAETAADARVNINTASAEELDKLDGVGEATAKKIIAYREKNGPFKNIEDIKNVSGIGESKFNGFKDMITVG